jgi:hypothetical protein
LKLKARQGKKFLRPPSQQLSWMWWYMSIIIATWELYIRLWSRLALGKNIRSYLKDRRKKDLGHASSSRVPA